MATLTLLRKIFLQTSLLAALVASQDVSGSYSTIKSPDGIQVRYKQPNICETTHGVQSYSGYVDLASDAHMFFWLFEARHSPASAPTTIWLSGGPGSDSLLATFIENGPCNITSATNLTTNNNPYSWNNNSNVIYISQPIGVGFSYGEKAPGSLNADTGVYETTPVNGGKWEMSTGYFEVLTFGSLACKCNQYRYYRSSCRGHLASYPSIILHRITLCELDPDENIESLHRVLWWSL